MNFIHFDSGFRKSGCGNVFDVVRGVACSLVRGAAWGIFCVPSLSISGFGPHFLDAWQYWSEKERQKFTDEL